ncbi:MAG: response regulator [Proteobacteria bacterium]|nr:response regulator [Pseudomonadota bacterium]
MTPNKPEGPIRILVVDDSPTVQERIAEVLCAEPDMEIIGQAKDGVEAVRMAASLAPDLIVMDVVMPDMDGITATRKIMAAHPTPILINTAHSEYQSANVVFEAMAAGALDVVAKPLAMDDPASEAWEQELTHKIRTLARHAKIPKH